MAKGIEFKGGKKLKALIKKINTTKSIKGYDVGFFKSAIYLSKEIGHGKKIQNPISVATVAAINEFGLSVPERPFFRIANKKVEKKLTNFLVNKLNIKNGFALSNNEIDKMGTIHAGEIQLSITELSTPPNAPLTIKLKGSSNPLIDTGLMRKSVTWKIIK